MESPVSPPSSELGEPKPNISASEKSAISTANGCQKCERFKKNQDIMIVQLSDMSRLRVQHYEGQKAVQQMTEQMAEHSIQMETLSGKIYNLQNQLRTAEMESETAKRREAETQKHLDILEKASAALRKKADNADMYKTRYERAVAVCDDLQRKRLMISESLKTLTEFAKKTKADAESSKQDCERFKADKMAAMGKIRMYKKHVPNMLKIIDELAKHAESLPIYTRRKIDVLASKEIRLQLLGGQAPSHEDSDHEEEDADNSDEDMAGDLETLIAGGVHVYIPEKSPVKATVAKRSPVKRRELSESPEKTRELTESPKKERVQPRGESVRRGRGGWRGARRGGTSGGHHNVDEAEKAFSAKLLSKLSKVETTQPLSEVSGGHSTIHGKRGPTVREQQAKMMSVAEKVALMRKEQDEPKKKTQEESLHAQPSTSKESAIPSSSDESSSPRRTRRITPDWHSDLRLTPSPVRSPAHSFEELDNEPLLTMADESTIEQLPSAPSMPHLHVMGDDYAPSPISSPKASPSAQGLQPHPSMPHLEEMLPARDETVQTATLSPPILKPAAEKRIPSPKKKVTFDVAAEEETEPIPTDDPIVAEAEERVEEVPEPVTSTLEAVEVETDSPETPTVETKRIARTSTQSAVRIEPPRMANSERKTPEKAANTTKELSAKATEIEAAPVPTAARQPEVVPQAEVSKQTEILEDSESGPVKISTPTKRALKTMSSVSMELNSPVKAIPEWSVVAPKFAKKVEEVIEQEPHEEEGLVIDELAAPTTVVPKKEDPKEPPSLPKLAVQETAAEKAEMGRPEAKPNTRTTHASFKKPLQLSKPKVSEPVEPAKAAESGAGCGRLRSAPARPTASKKVKEPICAPAPEAPKRAVQPARQPSNEEKGAEASPSDKVQSSLNDKVEAAPVVGMVDGADRARPAIRASIATASKSLTSQLDQKSMAINRRLRAAANRPVLVAVKKAAPNGGIPAGKVSEEGKQADDKPGTSTVETKRIARCRKETTERLEHPEMASSEEKVQKAAASMKKAPTAKALTLEAAPVPKTTRQSKRKAAAAILPPKKLRLTASPAETLLQKVLDMDCAVEVLTKKIPAEELEQIKTIDVETFANILTEHVVKMKSVDMWILVTNSFKKKSIDVLTNKTEENLLQVAYTLSSDEGNVFRSFVRNLLFKIVRSPNLDALLCHRIVRLVAMVSVAQAQIRAESEKDAAKEESRRQLEQLVKFLAIKRPHLLGKSLVYLVNRLPAEYIDFLMHDDCTDVLRLLVLYSDDEVCRNLQAYWHAKLNSNLPIKKREEICVWVKENLAFGSFSGNAKEVLPELFQLRSVYFTTPKTFPIALGESIDLLRQLESIHNMYKGDGPTDDIVASIFGGKSEKRLQDPDMAVIDELSERIATVLPLFDAVYRAETAIGRDRMRGFFGNLGSGAEIAHEILSVLSGQLDAAENRKILVSTLSEFLLSCQPISRHRLL